MSAINEWLAGHLSMGKMLEAGNVPYEQGSELVGGIWQAFMSAAGRMDREMENQIERSRKIIADSKFAEDGPQVAIHHGARINALTDARLLLRREIISLLQNVQAGA